MEQDYIYKPVRNSAILTNSYVAGTVLEDNQRYNQMAILVNFTKGSLTSMEVKVEFSPDNTNWYQETFSSVSVGTSTDTVLEHTFTATGRYRLPIQIKDRYIKVSAKGTGTVADSSAAIGVVLGTI